MVRTKRALLGLGVFALAAVAASALVPPVVAQVRAALVRDADHPARSSVLFTADVNIPNAGFNSAVLTGVIPPGKKLVVEFVAANCSSSSSLDRLQLFLQLRGPGGVLGRPVKIPIAQEPLPHLPDSMAWGAAEMTRLYADHHPEGSVEVTVGRFTTSGTVFCDINLSGHTVDAAI
jgi:hypothetical protein